MSSTRHTLEESTPAASVFATSPSLLERARHSDADAWKRIVRIYGPLVDSWCRRAAISRDDAEDVVQEIFLSVSKQLSQFNYGRERDTFRGWLRVIAKRRIVDYYRRMSERPNAEGGTTAFVLMQQAPDLLTDDPDAEVEEAGVSRRALELIRDEFEPRTWSAFWKTAIEGMKPAEISKDIGMSQSAIRMAKSRVLARLRQELSGLVTVDGL